MYLQKYLTVGPKKASKFSDRNILQDQSLILLTWETNLANSASKEGLEKHTALQKYLIRDWKLASMVTVSHLIDTLTLEGFMGALGKTIF